MMELTFNKSLEQKVRYLIAGAANTILGYGLFALFNLVFNQRFHLQYGYLLASILANILAITFAFLVYKWFVFKTVGNYYAEWIRCMGVYGASMLVTLVGLRILVPILQSGLSHREWAPYIAGAFMAILTVIASFFGHKHISFRAPKNAGLTHASISALRKPPESVLPIAPVTSAKLCSHNSEPLA